MTIAPTSMRRPRPSHRHGLALVAAGAVAGIAAVLLLQHDVFQGSTSSSDQGSGVAATQTRIVPSFNAVELGGSTIVSIHVGATQSVVVHADHNLIDRVTTQVRSGRLVIGTTGSFKTKSPMTVDVAVPSLDRLTLSGSGIVSANGVTGRALTVSLPGSGVLRATGAVTRLDVTLDGSGDAQLGGLVADNVRAVVDGSGRIVVNAARSLDASVPGSGAIVYLGGPARVTTSITGSGAVIPG